MLDFYFDNDPLTELETMLQKALEEALHIREKGSDEDYKHKMGEIVKIKLMIEQIRNPKQDA